jgi:hypothetical protein
MNGVVLGVVVVPPPPPPPPEHVGVVGVVYGVVVVGVVGIGVV